MKKYSSEYEKYKQEILESLVQPFIDAIFSTDTVNKLNDAQEIFNACLTHIELPSS